MCAAGYRESALELLVKVKKAEDTPFSRMVMALKAYQNVNRHPAEVDAESREGKADTYTREWINSIPEHFPVPYQTAEEKARGSETAGQFLGALQNDFGKYLSMLDKYDRVEGRLKGE